MLTCVCLDIDGSVMTLAATDRYRMAVRQLPWDPAVPHLRAAALVPARTLADVGRTLAPGVPVTVAFGAGADAQGPQNGSAASTVTAIGEPRPVEGMISFEGGGRRLTARLIAGDFIRYRSRFPAEFGCQAELPAGKFIDAVRRVCIVAERASPVRLAFRTGEVVIEAQDEGRAKAVESVPADFAGDEPVISFNPHYLLDGLVAAAGPNSGRPSGTGGATRPDPLATPDRETPAGQLGRIRLEFTSPAKPALITWVDGELPSGIPGASPAPAVNGDGQVTGSAGSRGGSRRGKVKTTGAVGSEAGDKAGPSHPAEAGRGSPDDTPAFRYLVVPLRVPVRT
jgi:DNA polymerase III sliding clamp (beta) subunit (PCNA family)